MAIIQSSYRHRTGSDADRQAATINARELTVTSDRREVWMGTELIGGKGYDAIAPDPSAGGYTVSTTPNWPVRYRSHFARVAPVAYSGTYTHTIILPNAGATPPRNGDDGTLFVVFPVAANAITIAVRNGTSGGTLLFTLTSTTAQKWKLGFVVTGGAWELIEAVKLDLE